MACLSLYDDARNLYLPPWTEKEGAAHNNVVGILEDDRQKTCG